MNKKIILFGWLLLIFHYPGIAFAEMRLLHVELSYSGSAVAYNLYKDGVQVCVSTAPAATSMDCNVELDTTPMTFVLTAVDAAGVESPQSAPYVLVPPASDPATGNYIPQANFTTNVTAGVAPLPVTFDASSSSDLGGLIISYAWDFGDSGTGSGNLIDYTYSVPGTYTVTLTVIDDDGASAVKTSTIAVSAPAAPPPVANTPPVAVMTATPLLQTGTSRVGFDARTSSDADGTITSYAWNFGDGDTAVGNYIEHEFAAVGDYTVILTVTDNQGASSQDQMVITVVELPAVTNQLPVAIISASNQKQLLHFSWDYTGTDPGLVGFRLYQNSRLVCEIANPAARQADCQAYVDTGEVQLWVTSFDQAGAESAASVALTFDSTGLFPAAGGDAPLVVHFTAGASSDPDGTITSYAWNFGDGAAAEGAAVDHVFTGPGEYTVTMTITDDKSGQAQATTVIRVADVNPPIAVNASLSTVQDKPVTATLNASDPDGRPLTFMISKDGSLGTATITNTGTGVFTYVPKAGESGADSFTFKANDGTFDSNEAVVSVTIEKKNSAPVATNQPLTTPEDTPHHGTLIATDVDEDPLAFSIVTPPAHGVATVTDSRTGTFQYSSETNYNGTDSFTFKANDGELDSVAATVSIIITPANDGPTATPDSAQVASGQQVSIAVLANDTDADNDTLTISSVSTPTHGQAQIVSDKITYSANADFNGEDSFFYTINDGAGGTATGTVTITEATPQESITYTWDYQATVPGLAGFRLYLNGEPLCETSNPTARTLTCQHPKSVESKSFYIKALDANGTETNPSNTITFTPSGAVTPPPITPPTNSAPTTTGQSLTIQEDAPAHGALAATDADSDPMTFTLVTSPTHGVAILADASTGAFSYTPTANYNGTDSFTFIANDGKADSAAATISLAITPVNDAPISMAASLSTNEDTASSGQLSGSDPDGDHLSYSIVTNGAKGTVAITDPATGSFTYTPTNNESGPDSFVYSVSDGALATEATVTVTITPVNDAPQVAEETLTTPEDSVASGQLTGSDPDGDHLSYSIVTNGAKGTVAITDPATGSFTYTPANNESGPDSFVYRANDGKLTADSTVTVTITPVNDAPQTAGETLTTAEDSIISGQLTGSDPDGDHLSYSIVTNGAKGTVAITDPATGSFTYTPTSNKNGPDTFVYSVSDGALAAEATVTVAIAPVNDAPQAVDISLWGTEDVTTSGQLPGSDPDGDPLSYSIITNGTKSTAVISDSKAGTFTVTPSLNQNGQDSIVYQVSDGKVTAEGKVTVTIEPVNDAPTANKDSASVRRGRSVSIPVLANDTDVDGNPLALNSASAPTSGTTSIVNNAVLYKANSTFIGKTTFNYTVTDGQGGTATGSVTVTVR